VETFANIPPDNSSKILEDSDFNSETL